MKRAILMLTLTPNSLDRFTITKEKLMYERDHKSLLYTYSITT